jgi:hypothetical protein
MRLPNEDGLPVWLFILVILLALASIALILFIVWCKCFRRPNGIRSLSSSISEPPRSKVNVRKGKIIRASWNISLTSPRFGRGAARQQSKQPSPQLPQTTQSAEAFGNYEKPSHHHFMREDTPAEHNFRHLPQQSWRELLRRHNNAGLRTSASVSPDVESARPSYISDSVELAQNSDEVQRRPQASRTESLWLDSPTPTSPITPIAMPRTPRNRALRPTSLNVLADNGALPPLPAKVYHIPRYREGNNPCRIAQHRDSRNLDQRSSLSRHDFSKSHKYRSSTATNKSFLQAWSSVYGHWLANPESSSSSHAKEATIPTSSDVDVAANKGPVSEDGYDQGRNISLPSLTQMLSIDSKSRVSRNYSVSSISSISDRGEKGRNLGRNSQGIREEISWLIDD